jgi:hypothetical protein
MDSQCFIVQGPGANAIKLLWLSFMNFPNKLEYLFPGKPLEPSLMFAGKAGAYPSEAPFRCSTIG